MPRTDVHRPGSTHFDPEAYELIEVYAKPAKTVLDDFTTDTAPAQSTPYRALIAAYAREGIHLAPHQRENHCGHCGTPLAYFAVLLHEQAGELILVGETCLDDRFSHMSATRFAQLRAMTAADRRRALALKRAEELTWDWHPMAADLTYPQITDAMGNFVADVATRFRDTGTLTPDQMQALESAFERHLERAAEREERARRDADHPVCDAPTGKITVTGEVIHVKVETDYRHSYHGVLTYKMIVWDDRGFKVWCTIPTALRPDGPTDALRGHRVEFTATLEQSDRDTTFSFGKRPTRARRLTTT